MNMLFSARAATNGSVLQKRRLSPGSSKYIIEQRIEKFCFDIVALKLDVQLFFLKKHFVCMYWLSKKSMGIEEINECRENSLIKRANKSAFILKSTNYFPETKNILYCAQ